MKKLIDFYEFTMTCADLFEQKEKEIEYYDVFFRKNINNTGYAISGGLAEIIEYIEKFKFTKEDIDYLRSLNQFDEKYLNHLKDFKFTGDLVSVVDGTVIFPNEPIMIMKGNAIEAKLLETAILTYFNHGSLITTRTKRISEAASGRGVLEFGARRAQGESAAIVGAKYAFIGGAIGTSNYQTGMDYDIPLLGTMAHSYITGHDSEYEAFLAYAKKFPNDVNLLVDTYDTLNSGVKNAIKLAKEYLLPNNLKLKSIRLDSGDLAYLSKEARRMLDEENLTDTTIVASNSLNEETIRSLINEGAKIDTFGVGENLITSSEQAVFGGVYKLVAVEKNNELIPKIKVSDNISKTITPALKKLYRLYDKDTNFALADIITLNDEQIPEDEYYTFSEKEPNKNKVLINYYVKDLHTKIYENGQLVYQVPTAKESKKYCELDFETIYPEIKRRLNPHEYYVNLSTNLYNLKYDMINNIKNNTMEEEKIYAKK